jgi:hypothetical protein
VLGVVGALSVGAVAAEPPETPAAAVTVTVVDRVEGRSAAEWRAEYLRMRRLAYQRRQRILSLEATLPRQPNVAEAINLACTAYRVSCATLWRKARCESRLYRFAQNRSSNASGLFQFLPSTWRTTPYAGFSIFSAHANALAAGWMHANGRSGEWVCR